MITMKLEGSNLTNSVFINVVKNVNDRRMLIKEVIIPAAKIVKKVMVQKAPVLKAPAFNVYRTPKKNKKQKAPKGMGMIYVSIKPNQLKKSISYFQTAATKRAGAVNIGPRYKKGIWKKPDKGGWYMHMVQFGTDTVKAQPFVLQALLATQSGVAKMLKNGMNNRLRNIVKKDGRGVLTYIG